MPLITKASRKGEVPAWQRGKPAPTKEQRDAMAIVANHERKFTLALNALLRDLLTPSTKKAIRAAVKANLSLDAIMDSIPFFDASDPSTFEIWESFAARMEGAYTAVINETIENERRKHGWPIETIKDEHDDIPVSLGADEFVRRRSLTRAVDLSKSEEKRIRAILVAALDESAHPTSESLIAQIFDTVGLTTFQQRQLERRMVLASAEGMGVRALNALRAREAAKIRLVRARAISRTETNDALTRGLTESWEQAASQGHLPAGTKKKWAAMPLDPGRSSVICQDLNGQEVDMNEDFHSEAGQGFVGHGPPAHPN